MKCDCCGKEIVKQVFESFIISGKFCSDKCLNDAEEHANEMLGKD